MALIQATASTGTAQVADLFASEYISRVVRDVASEPIVGMNFVELVDLTGPDVHSYTYQVAIWNELEGAAAVSENDAAPQDALETDQVQITGDRVAIRTFVLYKNMKAIADVVTKAAERCTRAVRRNRHEAIMDLATSLSNSQGDATTENDLANWDLVMHNLRAQNHDDGPLVASLVPDAVRDLRQDLVANAAALFGATWGDRAATALQNKSPGMGVAWDGVTVYQSADLPVGDTTGWTNFVAVVGPQAAIEMPVWQQLTPFFQPDESRFGTWVGVSIIAEPGIAKNANARAFITRT